MTVRAVLIGLVLALGVAALGYTSDWRLLLSYFASDLVPVSVFGLLVVALLTVNPLLSRLGRKRFSAGELAVMFSLMLVACVIPGPGLLWHLNHTLACPVSLAQRPGWGTTAEHPPLLDYVPAAMLVNDGRFDERVVVGFMQGLGGDRRLISPREVPWAAWAKTYAFYLPLIGLGFLATVCLSLIVHRQWAYREHLPYPVAEVAGELIRPDPLLRFNPIFHNRAFWAGFLLSAGVLMINGIATYRPGFVRVPIMFDFASVGLLWPKFTQASIYYNLFQPRVFFVAIGLAFLLASEASFSIGISSWVYGLLFVALSAHGVDMTWEYMSGGALPFLLFGAYLGGGALILYTGRKFYSAVLRRAAGLHSPEPVDAPTVWACRALAVCAAAMAAMLHLALGLDVLMSLLVLALVALIFLIVARVNAETGLLFVQPTWQAAAVVAGVFGAEALGPRALIIVGMLSLVLTIDPRVCLMPLVVNALKVSDRHGVAPPRLGRWLAVTLVAALVVGAGATLYFQYNYGASHLYGWANTAAEMPFAMLARNVDELAYHYALDSSGQAAGWGGFERLLHAQPGRTFLWATGLGLGLFLLCSAARLRWPWWPIHPVLFIVWGTIISGWFGPSFLLGWAIKQGVVRFGGGRAYVRVRPLFIGLIAGEMATGVFWMIVGAIYYAWYGTPGPTYRVHP